MRKSNQTQFREILREFSDGLTIAEISEKSGKNKDATYGSVKCMVDAYIDRWVLARGKYIAVWCVVSVPKNCPKPTRKKKCLQELN